MRVQRALERARALALAVLAGGAAVRADTLAEVQRAAEAGEFARGLQLARAEADPLESLRAQVWLRYRARDFEAAFAAAEQALLLKPDDLWLAERACAAALWIGEPARAQRTLTRFTASLHSAPKAAAEAFLAPFEAARVQTAELSSAARRADKAATRARLAGFSILAALLLALTWLGLDLRRRAGK